MKLINYNMKLKIKNKPISRSSTLVSRLRIPILNITELNNCPICIEPIKKPLKLKNCNHSFCSKCITTWLTQANSCPCCRSEVTNYEKAYSLKINDLVVISHITYSLDILTYEEKESFKIKTASFINIGQEYFLQQWKLYKLLYIDQDNELINIFQKLILKNETIVYQKEHVPEYIIENPIVYSFIN